MKNPKNKKNENVTTLKFAVYAIAKNIEAFKLLSESAGAPDIVNDVFKGLIQLNEEYIEELIRVDIHGSIESLTTVSDLQKN